MIKRFFLYKATRRGSEARSSEKHCHEEREQGREPEPEPEPERRSESLMRTETEAGTGAEIGSKVVKRETREN